jgi:hypothetical protein
MWGGEQLQLGLLLLQGQGVAEVVLGQEQEVGLPPWVLLPWVPSPSSSWQLQGPQLVLVQRAQMALLGWAQGRLQGQVLAQARAEQVLELVAQVLAPWLLL